MATKARHSSLKPEQKERFLMEMDKLFSTIRTQKLSEISVGDFLTNMLSVVRRYHVKIEPNFATLCVATVVLEVPNHKKKTLAMLCALADFAGPRALAVSWTPILIF